MPRRTDHTMLPEAIAATGGAAQFGCNATKGAGKRWLPLENDLEADADDLVLRDDVLGSVPEDLLGDAVLAEP